jgi:predicted TIM-barrel enzyme
MVWSDCRRGEEEVTAARNNLGWQGLYLGAVAFKYQQVVPINELPAVVEAAKWMDVLTTSGPGTGEEIDIEKAQVFSAAAQGRTRGIASGVSIDNIVSLLPHFDVFLVASSIQDDWHTLNLGKVKALAEAIHGWETPSE